MTRPSRALIGYDQHARSPCASARWAYAIHRGSCSISLHRTFSPRAAAVPQLPTASPIVKPFIVAPYSFGTIETAHRRFFLSRSTRMMEGMMSGAIAPTCWQRCSPNSSKGRLLTKASCTLRSRALICFCSVTICQDVNGIAEPSRCLIIGDRRAGNPHPDVAASLHRAIASPPR